MRRYCQQHGNIEKFRFENRYCTMYTNDDQLEQIFKSRLISIIDGVSKPVNEKHEKMMRESAEKCHERFKEKIVSSLPKNGFQYKINLFNLHGLIRKYPNMSGVLLDYDKEGLCILPERCKAALSESTSKYIWATHMYVKDEDTLNLLLLMLDHSNIHDIEVFKTF